MRMEVQEFSIGHSQGKFKAVLGLSCRQSLRRIGFCPYEQAIMVNKNQTFQDASRHTALLPLCQQVPLFHSLQNSTNTILSEQGFQDGFLQRTVFFILNNAKISSIFHCPVDHFFFENISRLFGKLFSGIVLSQAGKAMIIQVSFAVMLVRPCYYVNSNMLRGHLDAWEIRNALYRVIRGFCF